MNYGDFPIITTEQLNEKISSGDDFILIDTLIPEHFERVHIPESLNVCVHERGFIKKIQDQIKDKCSEIIVYGADEMTMDGIMAAEKLKENGYENVSILRGGLSEYLKKKYELEGYVSYESGEYDSMVKITDGDYTVDTMVSGIRWTGRNPERNYSGRVNLLSGEVKVKKGVVRGNFEIDMNSISIDSHMEGDDEAILISHLKSDDFFLTKVFPEAHFSIESAKPDKEPYLTVQNYNILGFLEMRGIKAKLDFPANLLQRENGKIYAEAHFDFDRTRWGIVYGSSRFFNFLGKHLVFDMVSVELRLVTL